MSKVLLFLASNDSEGEWYPFYHEPNNPGAYKEVRTGEFITLCNNSDSNLNSSNASVPIQIEIKRISLDESKDTKSIYLRSSSKEELDLILRNDHRWVKVLEGNP